MWLVQPEICLKILIEKLNKTGKWCPLIVIGKNFFNLPSIFSLSDDVFAQDIPSEIEAGFKYDAVIGVNLDKPHLANIWLPNAILKKSDWALEACQSFRFLLTVADEVIN